MRNPASWHFIHARAILDPADVHHIARRMIYDVYDELSRILNVADCIPDSVTPCDRQKT